MKKRIFVENLDEVVDILLSVGMLQLEAMLWLVGYMEQLLFFEHRGRVKVLFYMDKVLQLLFSHKVVQWWL